MAAGLGWVVAEGPFRPKPFYDSELVTNFRPLSDAPTVVIACDGQIWHVVKAATKFKIKQQQTEGLNSISVHLLHSSSAVSY